MAADSNRLISLDVFRGITIAGMILVNNPGSWEFVYPALKHAPWNGVTPTDLIFPFFLFIVGVAITLSLEKRIKRGDDKKVLVTHIIQRGVTIFLLGELMSGFPFFKAGAMVANGEPYWFIGFLMLFSLFYNLGIIISLYHLFPFLGEFISKKRLGGSSLMKKFYISLSLFIILASAFPFVFPDNGLYSIRIPGVLQRIAVVYSIASILFIYVKSNKIIYWIVGTLLVYTSLMLFYPVPEFGYGVLTPNGNFSAYIDNMILSGHMWTATKTWDPEGIFSTLPAIATALFGILTGLLLKSEKNVHEKISIIFLYGCLLSLLGVVVDMWIPINKSIWTSSYSLYCAGMAMLFLGVLIYLIDVKKITKVFNPFLIYGMNAITVFFLSGIIARVLNTFKISYMDSVVSVKEYFYLAFLAPVFGNINGSLAFALIYVLFWLLIMWILYRKNIFIKV